MYLYIYNNSQHEYDEDDRGAPSKVRAKRQQQQQRKRPVKKGGDGRRRDGVPSVNGVEKARFNDLKEAVNMSKVSSGTVEYKGVLSRASVVSISLFLLYTYLNILYAKYCCIKMTEGRAIPRGSDR